MNAILPRQAHNNYAGHRAALWLLGLYIALKLAMSFNSIFNTAYVAAGPDAIPLHSFSDEAVREVLSLFALMALGQLALVLIALVVLVRYRTLVPLVTTVLLGEAIARRLIVQSYAVARTDMSSTAFVINVGLIAVLAAALVLSMRGSKAHEVRPLPAAQRSRYNR